MWSLLHRFQTISFNGVISVISVNTCKAIAALESFTFHRAKSQDPKSIKMGTSSSVKRIFAGFRSLWAIADGNAVSKSITAESVGLAVAAPALEEGEGEEEEEAGAGGGE